MSQRVFSFHYTLFDEAGGVIDKSEGNDPLLFLEGSGQIIKGLEDQIVGLKVGDEKEVRLSAKDGYGLRDEKLVYRVPKDQLPQQPIKVGDMFQTGDENAPQVLTVTGVEASHVVLDANHPMAGKNLHFQIKMVEVRPATKEELAHGHAHGGDGHHH